ncbi:MAG TPA: aldo/keto reductase [Ignavibacteria bacterium]
MKSELLRKIGLGTAQFGMEYGINNKSGKIQKDDVFEVLNFARENGIDTIDTASVYGESEKIIGEYKDRKLFNIISKFSDSKLKNIIDILNATLKNLNLNSIYGYLYHSVETFKSQPDSLKVLKEIQSANRILKTGFSLYYTSDLEYLFDKDIEFELIQVPYSIFDRRFEPYFSEIKNRNIEIHIRSVFLQGLMFIEEEKLSDYFKDFKPKLLELDNISKERKCSKQEIALNFVLNNEFIDKVIIGLDNLNHLKETINITRVFKKSDDFTARVSKLKSDDEKFLLPFNWN